MTPLYRLMVKPLRKTYIGYAYAPSDTALPLEALIPLTDKSIIYADNKCTGCGTCARVCPARNIEMSGGKPVWQHHCEICFACDEWCPAKAIHHWSRADGVKYHHPEVRVKDMFRQN